MGNGLVTATNHEQWYKQRRIVDPAFSSLWVDTGKGKGIKLNLLYLQYHKLHHAMH